MCHDPKSLGSCLFLNSNLSSKNMSMEKILVHGKSMINCFIHDKLFHPWQTFIASVVSKTSPPVMATLIAGGLFTKVN